MASTPSGGWRQAGGNRPFGSPRSERCLSPGLARAGSSKSPELLRFGGPCYREAGSEARGRISARPGNMYVLYTYCCHRWLLGLPPQSRSFGDEAEGLVLATASPKAEPSVPQRSCKENR